MPDRFYFEDVEVGQTWKSPSRTVTEYDVIGFAQMTGDFNPLHVDQHFASESVFGRPIAHGLLGLSWAAGLSSQAPNMRTLAFLKVIEWSFLRPIFFGDTVHVVTRVLAKHPGGRRSGKIHWQRQLVNQRGEVTQEGIFETLVELRSPVSRPHLRHHSLNPNNPLPNSTSEQDVGS